MNTPAQKKRNKEIAAEQGCVVCYNKEGTDPAHFPVRQGHGAGWGLLEFLPLCRSHHRALDENNGATMFLVDRLSHFYYTRMYNVYKDDPRIYLGPPERIAEVRRGRLRTPFDGGVHGSGGLGAGECPPTGCRTDGPKPSGDSSA